MFDWLWRRGDGSGVDGEEPGGLALLDRVNDELERFGAPLNPSWARAGEEDDDLARLEDALRGTVDIAETLGTLSDHVGPRRRNRRDDVAKVELMLGGQGYLDLARTNGPTGYFGAPQEQAIRRLQADRGLSVDGWAAPDGETVASLRQGLRASPGVGVLHGGAGDDRPAPGPAGPVPPVFPHLPIMGRRQADAVLEELGGAARAIGDFALRNQRFAPRIGFGPPPFMPTTGIDDGPPPSVSAPRTDPALPGPSADPPPPPEPEHFPAEESTGWIEGLIPPALDLPLIIERRGSERVRQLNAQVRAYIEERMAHYGVILTHTHGARDKDGNELSERYLKNVESRGRLGSSYPDITFKTEEPKRNLHVQTVDTYADGSLDRRERANALKLYKNMGNEDIQLSIPKPKPGQDLDWDALDGILRELAHEMKTGRSKIHWQQSPRLLPRK